MTGFETMSDPLPVRIREGLERLAMVLRTEQWSAAQAIGVTPTQMNVLALLAGRRSSGIRVKDIASHLGVSQPTATDSIAALVRKDLVQKEAVEADSRATAVRITALGRNTLKAAGAIDSATDGAINTLTASEQSDLLVMLIKTIRQLQIDMKIPVQRMCLTCRHFRAHAHSGADHPHHCNFVNAAFGNRLLRVECSDHEAADPAVQAATWMAFNAGSANLQAAPKP